MKIFLYLFVGGWIFCNPTLSHASLIQEKKCSECHRLSKDGAEKNGLFGLKGHRAIGGLRASIYNAMPHEGVVALVEYMKEFKNTH